MITIEPRRLSKDERQWLSLTNDSVLTHEESEHLIRHYNMTIEWDHEGEESILDFWVLGGKNPAKHAEHFAVLKAAANNDPIAAKVVAVVCKAMLEGRHVNMC